MCPSQILLLTFNTAEYDFCTLTFVSKVISEIRNKYGQLQLEPISVKNIDYLYNIVDVACIIDTF